MPVPIGRRLRVLIPLLVLAVVSQSMVGPSTSASTQTAATIFSTTGTTTAEARDEAEEHPPDPGRVLRMGLLRDMTTDNYWDQMCQEAYDINVLVLDSTRPSLYSLAMPGINVIPDLALDPEPPRPRRDGDAWVVDVLLREDAVWSDGHPISAGDVAFTFDVVQEIGRFNCLQYYGIVEADSDRIGVLSVEPADEHIVRITFNREPGLFVWPHTIGTAPIMAEHFWAPHREAAQAAGRDAVEAIPDPAAAVWEEQNKAAESAGVGFDKSIEDITGEEVNGFLRDIHDTATANTLFAVSGVGDPSGGPMVFTGRTPNLRIRTVANPRYYRSGEIVNSGGVTYPMGPFIEEQVFSIYDTQERLVSALADGEIDHVLMGMGQSPPALVNLAKDSGAVALTNPTNGFWYLGFNLRMPPMSDPAFRRALAMMIDRDFLADELFQGKTVPAWTLLPEANLQYFDPEAAAEIASKYRNLNRFERLEAAVTILDEAGYTWERRPSIGAGQTGEPVVEPGEGVRQPDGTPVPELEILSPAPGSGLIFFASYAIYIERWLKDLGFEARAHITDVDFLGGQVWPGVGEPTFDLYLLGWVLGSPASPNFYDAFFHSRNLFESNYGFNSVGYVNPELDQLAERLGQVKTVEDAKQIVWQLEGIIDRDLPYIVLNQLVAVDVVHARLEVPFTETLSGLWNLDDLAGLVRIRE